MHYGTFQLGSLACAVPLPAVREVLHRPRLSPVPLAPEELLGMTLCRGHILPVFDLAPALGAPPSATPRPRVIVLTHAGTTAGLSVDTAATLSSPDVPTPNPQPHPLISGLLHDCRILAPAALFTHFESLLASAAKSFQPSRPRPRPTPAHA